MLWATLGMDGALKIRADEPIEAYALKQWEKQRAAGKASLIIETGSVYSAQDLMDSLGKDIVEFQKWKADRVKMCFVDVSNISALNNK